MSYYDDNTSEYHKRGIDYDLYYAIDNNPQLYDVDDIEKVCAVWEGQNDGDSWRWLFKLKNGKQVFAIGWCDYTGWDCQSYMQSCCISISFDAVTLDSLQYPVWGFDKEWSNEMIRELLRQLKEGKKQTWREKKDIEMGYVKVVPDAE